MIQSDNAAIADTVTAVFRSRAFAAHQTVSLGSLIVDWIWNFIVRTLRFTVEHPAIGIVLRAALFLVVAAFVLRIVYGLLLGRSPSIALMRQLDSRQATDWWSAAEELAARNDCTAAAHALYMALLTSAARQGSLSIHDSKTTGDYLREVRRRPGSFDFRRFSEFTHSYETVIYGAGTCDPQRYTSLRGIASAILGRDISSAITAS